MSTLYLLGGTGRLGMEVAKGLVTAEGFAAKKALIRDGTKAQPLRDLGWELVKVESLENVSPEDLADAKVVVSTLGGPAMVPTETAVVKAAKKAGASLFVPSQFGIDFRRWGTEFPFFAGKKNVFDFAAEEGLPTLCVFNALFSDFIFGFLAKPNEEGKVTMVGDGSAKITFTRRSDIGFVLAKALADPKYNKGGFLSLQGDQMSWKEGLDLYSKVTGTTLDIVSLDPQEALTKEQELTKKGVEGDMGSLFGAFALHLLGEPVRGNPGADLSAEAVCLDHKMETLEETFKDVYGSK